MIAYISLNRFKRLVVPFILTAGLGGCQTFDLPQMPSWSMPDIQNPFHRAPAENVPAPTQAAAVPAPAIDMSSPPLQCRIFDGSVRFPDNWQNYNPVMFHLRKSQQGEITFTHGQNSAGTARIIARYDGSGQKLVFCPTVVNTDSGQITCASIYALEDDFTIGIKRTLDIAETLRGGTIECKRQQAATPPPSSVDARPQGLRSAF